MTRIIIHGCNGAMGQVVSKLAQEMEDVQVSAGVDLNTGTAFDYPVFPSLDACDIEADVVVDFASAKAADHLLDYCAEKKLGLVLCTTGLSEAQIKKAAAAAEKTAVLRSANMSLGINTLFKLLGEAAKVLAGAGFDIEVVEKHHSRKLDAPSGTALALADSINEAMDHVYHY